MYPVPQCWWSGKLTYDEEDPLPSFKCSQQPLPLGLPEVARSTPKSLKMPWKKNHSEFWVKTAAYFMLRPATTTTTLSPCLELKLVKQTHHVTEFQKATSKRRPEPRIKAVFLMEPQMCPSWEGAGKCQAPANLPPSHAAHC